jgi:bacterial/archaeal transporter family protein
MSWIPFALLSAVAAAATAVLAKVGVKDVPSTLATAIRTVVILVFAWAIAIGKGEHRALAAVAPRSLLFLVLSGLATGVSWLAYFRALQLGPASRVAPVDKLSLGLTFGPRHDVPR